MPKKTPWTKGKKARVAAILRAIAGDGTLSALADRLELKDRSVLTNWLKRGQVPLASIPAVLKEAPAAMAVTASMLHPDGHLIEKEST